MELKGCESCPSKYIYLKYFWKSWWCMRDALLHILASRCGQRWWRSQEEHSARCLVQMALTCAEGPGVCECVVSFIHALHMYRGIFSSELNRIQPFWRQIIISMHHKVLPSYLISETSTLFFIKKYEAWIWRHTQRNNTIISLLIWYIFVLKNITVSFHQISFSPGLHLFFLQWRAL